MLRTWKRQAVVGFGGGSWARATFSDDYMRDRVTAPLPDFIFGQQNTTVCDVM